MSVTKLKDQKILVYGYKVPNEYKAGIRALVLEYVGKGVQDDVDSVGREVEDWVNGGPKVPPGLGPWIWEGTVTYDPNDIDGPVDYEGKWRRLQPEEVARMLGGEEQWRT